MKIIDLNNYEKGYPEEFNWQTISSFKLTYVALALTNAIRQETYLLPDQRNNIAGLRMALNIIAEYAEV